MKSCRRPAVLLLLLGLGCARAVGGAAGQGAAEGDRRSSLERVAQAKERGEIDPDTAVLYAVLAVKDASKLPPEYRGPLHPSKEGTLVLRDARRRFPRLRPEIQSALKPYLFPEDGP